MTSGGAKFVITSKTSPNGPLTERLTSHLPLDLPNCMCSQGQSVLIVARIM